MRPNVRDIRVLLLKAWVFFVVVIGLFFGGERYWPILLVLTVLVLIAFAATQFLLPLERSVHDRSESEHDRND
jgi:uncharacterized membrane protein